MTAHADRQTDRQTDRHKKDETPFGRPKHMTVLLGVLLVNIYIVIPMNFTSVNKHKNNGIIWWQTHTYTHTKVWLSTNGDV